MYIIKPMNSFENISMITQPKNLNVDLYPHQLSSVYKMEEREHTQKIVQDNMVIETNIGVNADSTGYGKTLSMVALVLRDKMTWGNDQICQPSRRVMIITRIA